MKTQSKRLKNLYEKKSQIKSLSTINEIIEGIKSCCTAKFDESIDISIKLGTNPKKSDESIRGSFNLPHGIPKKIKVAAFVSSNYVEEARKAGADVIGLDDLVEQIKRDGKVDFDFCFASQDALPKIVSISKILGQAGVMPSKKEDTVTNNIYNAISAVKSGQKCLFRNNSAAFVLTSVGKKSMETQNISENIKELVSYLNSLKPPKVKEMIKKIYINSTMGISLEIPVKMIIS